jgi:chemotaxis protein MotA
LFGKQRFIKKQDAARRLVEYAKIARKDGLLALESQAEAEKDRFMKRGLQMMIDGTEPSKLEEILLADIDAMEQRHAGYAQIFAQAGSYAPTLGVLGAVLGLIAALADLNDTEKMSHAISAAFMATVLGIFTGYVMWNPMANHLKRKNALEVQVKHLITDGVVGITKGTTPQILEESLYAYLTEKERKGISGGKE